MEQEFRKIETESRTLVRETSGVKELEELRVKYLGRKGALNLLLKKMGALDPDERPVWGKKINALKRELEDTIRSRREELSGQTEDTGNFDPTLPPELFRHPGRNPVISVLEEVSDIFVSMGFGIAYGPDIETDYYNFTALNFPEGHPARDMHDTFYIKGSDRLLRTHTSPVQVRVMEKQPPPYQFIAPGKCYRRDTIDASHLPSFHQVEGLMVDKDISFAHLKGVLDEFARRFFPGETVTRFRPSFFPFTEPSAEMDIRCTICSGGGCSSCSGKGFIEILGAGMVDPEVFRHCGVDPDKWQGFAFGMGIERMAMLKYGISDLRYFFQNHRSFLEQF